MACPTAGSSRRPRILEIVRQSSGSIPQQTLRDACGVDDPPVDVMQAVQLLQAAGLVGVSGSMHADPLQVRPIASIVNLPRRPAAHADPIDRLDADVAAVLAQLHRFGRDFHGKDELLEEQVFSSVLAVGLKSLGWSTADRELLQAAGFPDLRVTGHGLNGHAVIEVKIWPRNDYKEIQAQLDAYRVSDSVHAIAVMLGARKADRWAEDYVRECLTGCSSSECSTPPDLVGCWRVETLSPADRPLRTTHFLVQIPKRA